MGVPPPPGLYGIVFFIGHWSCVTELTSHFTYVLAALGTWVPKPGPMEKEIVKGHIRLTMKRMNVDKLDMLQFHWWDYSDERYLDALNHLQVLQSEGLIGELSVTNFNTEHLRKIVESGIKISTNQLQYSLLDRRPAVKMAEFCEAHGIYLLAYGVMAGGLFSEKYLDCKEPVGSAHLTTASLAKYKQLIDAWGGWDLFQTLLKEMQKIADAHGVSIANVAARYILDKPVVAAVIIGCRFSRPGSQHITDNLKALDFTLSSEEISPVFSLVLKNDRAH